MIKEIFILDENGNVKDIVCCSTNCKLNPSDKKQLKVFFLKDGTGEATATFTTEEKAQNALNEIKAEMISAGFPTCITITES